MRRITPQSSFEAEKLEERFQAKGLYLGAVTWNPVDNKIYLGDGRDGLDSSDWLINVGKLKESNILAASGKDRNSVKGVYSNKYLQMLDNKKKILDIRSKVFKNIDQIGKTILGASGPTATTDYDNIRRTGDLLSVVIGEEHTNEDYQAINIANKIDKDSVKFEYLKRTTARIVAQKNVADDEEALPVKHAYALGTKEIFAYGLQWVVSMRDKIDTKTDITADFLKQVPDAFLLAKNEDVITLLNAIAGNNQGDWDAMTTAGKYDVDAAAQVQTAEDAVKKYGGPLVCIMNSDTWRLYMKNQQGVYFNGVQGNVANRSTSTANMKSGTLPGNPAVTYYIDDLLTSQTYVLAAQKAYMAYFQGMVIQSSYQNPKTPGKTEQRFWYDFAGFEETQPAAAFKGTSVGA